MKQDNSEKPKKIAIILSKLEEADKRKYQIWPKEYTDGNFEIRCFSINRSEGQDEWTSFDAGEGKWNLRRLVKSILKWFPDFLTFFKSNRASYGIKKSLRLWSKFAPLHALKPDVIHFVEPGLVRIVKPMPPNAKSVTSFRGGDILVMPYIDVAWKEYLTKELFPSQAIVHLISNCMVREVEKFSPETKNILMLHMGMDEKMFVPQDKKSNNFGKTIIVTSSRLSWQKGLIFALNAIKQLKDEGFALEYHIVGDGNLYNQLAYWSRYLGIQDDVFLHGRVRLDEVRDILNTADIYLQPSISECLCIATIEGMAMELPVVATTVGGFPEIVDEGESGFLVPPGDADAIALALKKLIQEPEMANAMGRHGRKIVLKKFTLDIERQNWLQIYRNLTK